MVCLMYNKSQFLEDVSTLTSIEIANKGISFHSKEKKVNLSHIDFKFPKGDPRWRYTRASLVDF